MRVSFGGGLLTELEEQRQAWERLENNHKRVLALPWEEFDHIDSAKIPRALDFIHVLNALLFMLIMG